MIGLQYGMSRRFSPVALSGGYIRPVDWLPLPTISEGEQKLVALVAVFPHESNHHSVICSGDYTVDWGDGTVQNFTSGVQANRNYSYNSIPANNTSRGYRQVIMQITPQAGHNLTSIDFNVRHPAASAVLYNHNFLDIKIRGAMIGTLRISRADVSAGMLEQFEFAGSNSILDFSHFLYNCYALRSLVSVDTSQGKNFTNFLLNCFSLALLPPLDLTKGEDFTNFLLNGRNIQSLVLNTSQGQIFTSFLNGCRSLNTVWINTSQGQTFGNLLFACNGVASLILQGQKETVSVADLSLGRQALVNLFNGLATVTGKTITISGNYGAALLTQADRNIAINKGWTIVG